MKQKIQFLLPLLGIFLFAVNALAFKADGFKGIYPILSPTTPGIDSYIIIDTNTLGILWSKYSTAPLPDDLASVKDEPAIIAAFTNRNLMFLTLESTAVVGTNFLHLLGDNTEFELVRQANGQSNVGVAEDGNLSNYLLGVPSPL